ncbi:hypothetical protein BBJ28_00006139 [Nothophytophthora sp. Chile5]|nr:hypothetical protein BBJ28_00006139 [Nothophytophthora sp. Chile5]
MVTDHCFLLHVCFALQPSNILVDQYGVVKLADFGASRLISSATTGVGSPSNTRSLRGTPNYMAPEVIKQTVGRSRKADVWSIGCSVLRLLTGRALWGDQRFNSQAALLYYIANLDVLPPLPDSLSPEAHRFISACLQIDPAKRPTAAELLTFPFVQVAGLKVDLPLLQPVGTPRRNTAPAASSPMRDLAAQGRKQEQQQQAESVKGGGASSTTKRVSLVAALFTPRDGAITPSVAPEQEVEGNDVHELAGGNLSSVATQEENNHDIAPINWEEQPISTAAANVEREKRHAQAAEAERRRLERERKFQEELANYRREAFAGRS